MIKKTPTFEFERELKAQGYKIIAGVDEVGRGCLAGPIVVAAVVFSDYEKVKPLKKINDSKVLTKKQREELSKIVLNKASHFAYGEVTVEEIDKFGIGAANVMAFKRALDKINQCDFALIDGRKFRGFEYKYRCLEKGESKSISIAAASIIAKVYRDSLMQKLHKEIPEYGFETNMGYASDSHCEALRKLGPSLHHRRDFIRWLEESESLPLF